MKKLLLMLLCIASASIAYRPALAQEFTGLGGWMKDYSTTHDESFSWQLEYREGLGEHFAFSFSYLNEGHIKEHHRDGHAFQLWVRGTLFDRRLSVEAGLGPFFYYDTTRATIGDNWSNDHSWGGLLSISATWYLADRWMLQARANITETATSFDTMTLLFGLGYQLAPPPVPGPLTQAPAQAAPPTKNEITVLFGQTIVNSFGSESAFATSIEYRRSLLPAIDWSVAFLYEGENDIFRRQGIITELWGVRRFFNDRFSLAIGAGLYYVFNSAQYEHLTSSQGKELSGIVTLSGNYRFTPHWGIRASWDRIVTSYDRDTDVILAGIGYHF